MSKYVKYLQLMGLAQRAGKLLSGTEGVMKALRSGQVRLVIAAEDLSESARRNLEAKCQQANVAFMQLATSEEISQALGKKRSVLALTDQGFAKSFLKSKGHTTMQ
ncbi:hypothetical protein D3H64_09710 [Atopobacter sp. AH10]|uniref:L7Ae/L30e/S12e/Gadd45 family ribosomal protein n=1 Tax=Atopobacter sp. AH10 TaxID=2315861 RepID=UPI000EF2804A|nr:ribosomal L7Ae/L30e/S12e/Gadd45 family protein [Atopobacter sp. AH10]RLK62443.1 hypothetical protein D3H64_09710 [Atopobacter sp. AH10]